MALSTFSRRAVAATLAAPALAVAVAGSPAQAQTGIAVTKIEGAAANAAGLAPTVAAYRALLGDPDNGGTPGSQPGGRREINWDGVPDDKAAPALLPRDFFNTTSPRGAVFSSGAHNRFAVSADSANPAGITVRFANINPTYASTFRAFSQERLFSPLGTTKMRIRFFEPGTMRPATVKGFGAVFTDVDRSDSTKVELYDRWGHRLWGKNVLPGSRSSRSLSFLGVKTSAAIYEVRITSGNAPLGRHTVDDAAHDLVVMDDFLYSEPHPLH